MRHLPARHATGAILLVLCAIIPALLQIRCSRDSSVSPPAEEFTSTGTIGPQGGTITTGNRITLIVPAGALQQDTEITLTSLRGSAFDEFGIIGVRLEPDGLTFGVPATVQLPLPAAWDGDERPMIYEASHTDPAGFFVTGIPGNVVGEAGAYMCEIAISHFSSLGAAANCHAGTLNYLLDDFVTRGCTVQEMTNQVTAVYGSLFHIDPWKGRPDEFWLQNIPMQCFLSTYFDDAGTFETGEPVSEALLDELRGHLQNGKRVVAAFSTSWQGVNSQGFYTGFAHTAALELVNNELKLRQSVSAGDDLIERLVVQNGLNAFWYPSSGALTAAGISEFRELRTGVGLEMELCGTPGCIWVDRPVENRPVPYSAIRFYVSKYSGTQNPCETGTGPEYTRGNALVRLGSMVYLKTDLLTGQTYTSTTCCQTFGNRTYTGGFVGNRFTGFIDEVRNTGNQTDTTTGTLIVDLNATQDTATDVYMTMDFRSLHTGLSLYTRLNVTFIGVDIPLSGPFGSTATFLIEGLEACGSIATLDVFHSSEMPGDPNNNYEETLKSFECDTDSRISIFFSRQLSQ